MSLDIAAALAGRGQLVRPPAQYVLGRVVSASGTTVTVQVGDANVSMPRLRSYSSPVADDVVLCLKLGEATYCLGALNAAAKPPTPDDDPPPPPPPPKPTRTRSFKPEWTGTWRDGRWRGDTSNVFQGGGGGSTGHGRNYGATYYGGGPSSLRGDAVRGNVKIRRLNDGAYVGRPQAPTLRLLPNKNRPSGKPDHIASMRAPEMRVNTSQTVSLPTSWVQKLINGDAGGIGVGVDADYPHLSFAGRSAWSSSFLLTVVWRPT